MPTRLCQSLPPGGAHGSEINACGLGSKATEKGGRDRPGDGEIRPSLSMGVPQTHVILSGGFSFSLTMTDVETEARKCHRKFSGSECSQITQLCSLSPPPEEARETMVGRRTGALGALISGGACDPHRPACPG